MYWPPSTPTINGPSNVTIDEKQSTSFTAKVTEWGNPSAQGLWFKNSSELGNSNLTLMITNAQTTDGGKYQYGLKWKQNPLFFVFFFNNILTGCASHIIIHIMVTLLY